MRINLRILLVFILVAILSFCINFNFFNTNAASRPSTLEKFISNNGVKDMSDSEIESKIQECIELGEDEGIMTISLAVNDARRAANSIYEYYDSVEEQKKQLNNLYKEYRDSVGVAGEGDYQFNAMAYVYAKEYISLEAEEDNNNKPVDEIEDDDWGNEVKEVLDDYKNASTDAEKSAAARRAQELLQNMPADKKDETIDGRTAEEVLEGIIDAEQNRDLANSGDSTLYKKPTVATSANGSEGLEDMMNDGDDFIKSASDSPIKLDELQSTSSNLYNIFVEVGVALAVLIGLVIGIKYMYSSVDSKAEIKKLLVPYLVGCVVIFGALGIWKLMVNIMESF